MDEFYLMVEYDIEKKWMKVIKISADRSSFFDIPALYQDLKYHPSVSAHPQFKQFVSFLTNSSPKTKPKYVRNLKFSKRDKDGKETPESKTYINSEGQFRVKVDAYQYLATPEPVYQAEPESVRLNYSGQELLEMFSELFNRKQVYLPNFPTFGTFR